MYKTGQKKEQKVVLRRSAKSHVDVGHGHEVEDVTRKGSTSSMTVSTEGEKTDLLLDWVELTVEEDANDPVDTAAIFDGMQ